MFSRQRVWTWSTEYRTLFLFVIHSRFLWLRATHSKPIHYLLWLKGKNCYHAIINIYKEGEEWKSGSGNATSKHRIRPKKSQWETSAARVINEIQFLVRGHYHALRSPSVYQIECWIYILKLIQNNYRVCRENDGVTTVARPAIIRHGFVSVVAVYDGYGARGMDTGKCVCVWMCAFCVCRMKISICLIVMHFQ